MHHRWVRTYYAFQFFFSLLIWLPVFYQYQRAIGLSDVEIFGIQSLYYIVFCVLEIPTGVAADRFGYRRSLQAGAWVLVAANLLPILLPNYVGMAAHFLLIALARSFVSGASSAYLYEGIGAGGGDAGQYKGYEGKARAYGLAGKVVFWTGVGSLMAWHLTAPYWLTVASSLLAVGFAHALPKFAPGAAAPTGPTTWQKLGAAWELLRDQPRIPLVMLQGVAIFVLGRIVQVNLFQPLLLQKGARLEWHGAVMALMTVFEALGSFLPATRAYARFCARRGWGDWQAVSVLTIGMSLSMLALTAPSSGVAVAALALFSFVMGVSFPVQKQLMNDVFPRVGPAAGFRATLLSIESIIDRAFNAGVALVVGHYVAQGALSDFLMLSAAVAVVATVLMHQYRPAPSLTCMPVEGHGSNQNRANPITSKTPKLPVPK